MKKMRKSNTHARAHLTKTKYPISFANEFTYTHAPGTIEKWKKNEIYKKFIKMLILLFVISLLLLLLLPTLWFLMCSVWLWNLIMKRFRQRVRAQMHGPCKHQTTKCFYKIRHSKSTHFSCTCDRTFAFISNQILMETRKTSWSYNSKKKSPISS